MLLVLRRIVKKSKEKEPSVPGYLSMRGSPTRRSRGRGVMLWPVFPQFRPPAPISSGVGRKRRKSNSASGGCFHGASGPWRCGRESLRLHHAGFFGYCCHSWFGVLFQPAGVPPSVVQAVRPPSHRSAFARGSGWAARFLWSGWGAKCRPYRGPTGRSSGRGVTFWLRG